MTFAEALTGSPLLYPIGLDLRTDAVQLVRLSADEYAAASFLDGRLLKPGTPTAPAPWEDVRAAADVLPARCHFVFHISHVGSTLLSRLLGRHPALFCLREPGILRFLADAHWMVDEPTSPWDRTEFEDRLRIYLSLWSRTFEPGQTAAVKATSFVSEMASDLMQRWPAARSVFMFVGPEVFLRALLGGAMSDIEAGAEKRLSRLHRRLGGPRWRLADMSPGECVAMSWLCEMTALRSATDRFPTRVLWLDFDRFLAAPAEGLTSALAHFGVGDAAAAAQTILAGPTMHQYAKAPTHPFDAARRRHLLDEAGRQHRAEIAKGLAWLDSAAANTSCSEVLQPTVL